MLIEGRIFDMFITPSGKYLNPLVLLGNLQNMGLRQYQLVQVSAREIKIRYVGGAEPAEVANAIIPEVRSQMGPDISVTAESLTTLDVPGRKTRVFVSEVEASESMGLES
jgi:phenylacetate-coenzyme A ligase PaaK-like adenylate-forming protein